MARVTVVGAGIGGLVAAALAREAGYDVVVLERSERVGGRAASTLHDVGHGAPLRLNLGPRALFRTGAAWPVLARLGYRARGFVPPTRGGLAWRDGALAPFLDAKRAWLAARLLAAAPAAPLSLGAWLDALPAARDGDARAFIEALIRVTNYSSDPRQSAAVALAQVRRAVIGGVRYLDGGWRSIVDALVRRCETLGVALRTGVRVHSLGDIDADLVVLAVPPDDVTGLTGRALHLQPVRAATLDVILDGLPVATRRVVFGVGAPLYFAVHTRPNARGPVIAHAMQYLGADDVADRALIERLVDDIQPGWRRRVLHERYLPSMTVQHGLAECAAPVPPQLDARTYLVGDYVGGTGLMVDRAVASAVAVVRLLAARSEASMAA